MAEAQGGARPLNTPRALRMVAILVSWASGGTLFPITLSVQLVFLAKNWSIYAAFLLEVSMNSVPVIRSLF